MDGQENKRRKTERRASSPDLQAETVEEDMMGSAMDDKEFLKNLAQVLNGEKDQFEEEMIKVVSDVNILSPSVKQRVCFHIVISKEINKRSFAEKAKPSSSQARPSVSKKSSAHRSPRNEREI